MTNSGEKTISLIVLIIIVLFFLISLFYLAGFPMRIHNGFIIPFKFFPLPLLPPFLFLILGIIIVFWVYRDAERRGMSGILWALLVLVGNIVGLIIYLIVRNEEFPRRIGDELTQSCPSCGKAVPQRFAFCPHCGTRLKAVCPNCDKTVASDWKVCPYCGQQLLEAK
jgi:RNA polymerase subunit RPABC4/transcription elongation factor Spt4